MEVMCPASSASPTVNLTLFHLTVMVGLTLPAKKNEHSHTKSSCPQRKKNDEEYSASTKRMKSVQSVAVSPGEVVRRKEGVAQRGRQQSGGREERRPKKKVKGRAGGEEASRGEIKGGSSGGEAAYCIPRDQVKSEGWQSSEEEKKNKQTKTSGNGRRRCGTISRSARPGSNGEQEVVNDSTLTFKCCAK